MTRFEQIPIALFEILALAAEIKTPEGQTLRDLADSVIDVALADPETWIKLQNMVGNGYQIAFLRQESGVPVIATED